MRGGEDGRGVIGGVSSSVAQSEATVGPFGSSCWHPFLVEVPKGESPFASALGK